MKHLKHLLTVALTMLVALAVAVPAFADPVPHSITVKNENQSISINGRTYSAYKLFDSTHKGDAYAYTMKTTNQFYSAALVAEEAPAEGTLAAVLRTYFDFTVVPGDTTKVNVTPKAGFDAAAARTFADAIQPFLTGKTADATSPQAANEQAVITLPDDEAGQGYYIVTGDAKATDPNAATDTVVSAVILTNEDPTPVVKPKAGIPTLNKQIKKVQEGEVEVAQALLDDDGKAAVAKVGSTVSYELESIVPDLTGYTKYTFIFSDAISDGLTYVKNSFVLTFGEGDDAAVETIAPVFAEGDKSFTLTIPKSILDKYAAGTKIFLNYDATVNSSALTYDYENNTAKLTYSHSPYDDVTNETPEKETYVLDLNIDVLKVDGKDETTPLDGAKFKLYREVTTTTGEGDDAVTTTDKQFYKWDTTNNVVTWVAEANADVFTTDANGNLDQQVRGLDKGTYFLLETQAPTGFNLLAGPVTVVISAVEGNDNKVTYSATYNDKAAAMTNGVVDLSTAQAEAQPVATGTILNESGVELPSTGGIGTTIFYVIGGAMVITAGVLLVTKRRMAKIEA